jgi:riboflavin biosynthesis pyrimidine reductase
MAESFLVDRLWPEPATGLALDELLARHEPPQAVGRPSVTINMVTSIDGRAQIHGTAEGLGSRVDRRLMRLYRAAHDGVASGAGTVRASGVWLRVPSDLAQRRVAEGRVAQPLSVVIAGTTPIDPSRWHGRDEARLLVVGNQNPQQPMPGVELLRAPTNQPDPRWVLDALQARGVRSILLEGGPRINAAFLRAECLDEVCWTLGASLVASDALGMIAPIVGGSPFADAPRPGHLASVLRNGDELFLRYRFG